MMIALNQSQNLAVRSCGRFIVLILPTSRAPVQPSPVLKSFHFCPVRIFLRRFVLSGLLAFPPASSQKTSIFDDFNEGNEEETAHV
jgi:hypothetical protein